MNENRQYDCKEADEKMMTISLTQAQFIQASNALNWTCENLADYNEELDNNCLNCDVILHRTAHLFAAFAEEITDGL